MARTILTTTSSPGRFSLALEVGREKALLSAGQSVILIGWLIWVVHVRKLPNENNLSNALYRDRNGVKYVHSNEDFCKKSSLKAMWWFSRESLYASNIQQRRLSKGMNSKIYKTSGIKICEDDTRSAVLRRSGVTFIDKMDQFIRRAQSVDNTLSDLNSEYSVKRCVQLLPNRLRISCRSVYQRICHPKA